MKKFEYVWYFTLKFYLIPFRFLLPALKKNFFVRSFTISIELTIIAVS